jgi:hypothetical protein
LRSDTDAAIQELLKGYKRQVAQFKQTNVMKMTEGKVPLNFSGYRYLAAVAFKYPDYEVGMFAHLFLILCWNLIARCVSVASLMLSHITWKEDALVVVFPQHKGNQEGKNTSPKHVYANPEEPMICPILSLAIYIFCEGQRFEGGNHCLFGVPSNEDHRFSKWLKKVLEDHKDRLEERGLIIDEVGTHSFRKGIRRT